MSWETADLQLPANGALARDTANGKVSATLVSQGDDTLVSFSIKIAGLTQPELEDLIDDLGDVISDYIEEHFDATYKPEGTD